jgi:hypothetical protein
MAVHMPPARADLVVSVALHLAEILEVAGG